MAGECGFEGDGCCELVSDFADHNDIWVVAEEGSEGGIEGDIFLLIDLDLDGLGEDEFDGVFDGEDAEILIGEELEHGVEGGGFTGACGAGEEDEALRLDEGI